jgi:hypothetical protein
VGGLGGLPHFRKGRRQGASTRGEQYLRLPMIKASLDLKAATQWQIVPIVGRMY